MTKKTVLFICSFNSVRSRIAEALLSARCGEYYTVFSAGIAPVPLNPYAAEVLREVGIAIPRHPSTSLTAFYDREFDTIVTLCDHVTRANLRLPSGKEVFHRAFYSPCEIREDKGAILADFRKLRDRIDRYLAELFPEYTPITKPSVSCAASTIGSGSSPWQRRQGGRP